MKSARIFCTSGAVGSGNRFTNSCAAPSAPITAMRAVGHAKFRSAELLGPHDRVGATVGLADGDRHLRHVGLDERVEEPPPRLMMPPFSCSTPGMNPVCRRRKPMGVLYESQNLMNRAALSDASLSIAPDIYIGWLAITPTGRPSTRANAVIIACPAAGDLEDVTVVEDPQQDLVHVVGHVVASGTIESSSRSCGVISGSRPGLTIGGSSKVLAGRKPGSRGHTGTLPLRPRRPGGCCRSGPARQHRRARRG